MTHLTALMLNDTSKATTRKGALTRLRARLTGSRRTAGGPTVGRPTAGRPTNALLHDVALGGTAATAANNFLEKLATGRRA